MDRGSPAERERARRALLERLRTGLGAGVAGPTTEPTGGSRSAETATGGDRRPAARRTQERPPSGDALGSACGPYDGPISVFPRGRSTEGVFVDVHVRGYEGNPDKLAWFLDGEPMDEPYGAWARDTVGTAGRHEVAVTVVTDADTGGQRADLEYEEYESRSICLHPIASAREIPVAGTETLEYLDRYGYPGGPGTLRWFSARDSFVDDESTYEWSIDAASGSEGRTDPGEPMTRGEPVVPIRVTRPGEFTVRVTVETAEGDTAHRDAWLEVPVDPDVRVRGFEDVDGHAHVAEVWAYHPFWTSDDVDHRWYLDDQDELRATGRTAEIEASVANKSVRLELEYPGGTSVTRAPLVGDRPSRWLNGTTINTPVGRGPEALISRSGDVRRQVDPAASGQRTDDVLTLSEPRTLWLTAGEDDRPRYRHNEYDWAVKYSRRFREGPEADGTVVQPGDLAVEYGWEDEAYEPRSGVLCYPFTEPGWYVVELKLDPHQAAEAEWVLPTENEDGDKPDYRTRYDFTCVHVEGPGTWEAVLDPWRG